MKRGHLTNYAFWIGAIIAILVGIGQAAQWSFTSSKWIQVILVVLGVAVGLVNITAKEMTGFLVAALGLFVTASVFSLLTAPGLGGFVNTLGVLLGNAVQQFSVMVAGAAIVVAIKEAWMLAAKK